MKLHTVILMLTAGAMAWGAEMQNGRIRFEESAELKQTGKTVFFPVFIEQKSGDHLVIEGEDFSEFAPMRNEDRPAFQPEYSNGCAIVNAGRLAYDFSIAQPGDYQVWIRAFFPLKANYNHSEKMDDGEARNISDSMDPAKGSKTARKITSNNCFLEPGFWHWTPNFSYRLANGKHHWDWGRQAWCGGCMLDKIVLIRKGSPVKPEEAGIENRVRHSPENGTLLSRRIRTERLVAWQFEYAADPGSGTVSVEYSYDEKHFYPLKNRQRYTIQPGRGEYLWIRIRMKNDPAGKRPPIIYHYAFRFEKRV